MVANRGKVPRTRTSRPGPWQRPLDWTARLVIALAVGGAVWSTVRAITRLNQAVPPVRTAVARADTETLPPPPPGLLAGGTWTWNGFPWDVATRCVTRDELERHFDEAAERIDSHAGVPMAPSLRDALWGMLARAGGTFADHATHSTADLRTAELWVRLDYRRSAGQVSCLAARFAFPRHADQWTLLEAQPRLAAVIGPAPAATLPYEGCGERIAARRGDDGQLQCEVVSLQVSVTAWLDQCRGRGWHIVRPTEVDNCLYYVCHRAGQTFHVRALPAPASGRQNLVLIFPAENSRQVESSQFS